MISILFKNILFTFFITLLILMPLAFATIQIWIRGIQDSPDPVGVGNSITFSATVEVKYIETLRPDARGDECNIARAIGCSACPYHYTCVDDTGSGDGDDSYVRESRASYIRDLYNLENYPTGSGTINSVTLYFRVKGESGGNCAKGAIKTYTLVDETEEKNPGTTYTLYSKKWTTNPYTGSAWTWDEINALQAGVALKRSGSFLFFVNQGRCTQVYVEVEYSQDLDTQLFICKDSNCTNCGTVGVSNCWCYSSISNESSKSCSYLTTDSDIGTNEYWVKACDYAGTCSGITGPYNFTVIGPPQFTEFSFDGTLDYFNIYWKITGEDQTVNTTCYLNCDPDIEDCPPAQTCSYTQLPREGLCTISDPSYNLTEENYVTCIARYQAYPDIKTKVNQTFLPIDFKVSIPEQMIVTVGTPTEIRVDIKNTGALSDSYNLSFNLSYPEYASIFPDEITTPTATKNEIVTASSTLTVFLDKPNALIITISSNLEPSITQTIKISIATGPLALPEFHLFGLIQIVLLATILFFVKSSRSKNFHPNS